MTTKKTSRTKKPVVSKAPEDPARHRYTEEEMDALIDKAWPEEKVEAYFRAEREDAPIPVVHDFAVMRPRQHGWRRLWPTCFLASSKAWKSAHGPRSMRKMA